MQECHVDVAIVGAGSAGLSAYRAAKRHTDAVMLIEGGEHGTTCARTGCMPSKLLIAAANAIHRARHIEPFGGRAGPIDIDGKAVMARVQRERRRFFESIQGSVADFPDEDVLQGKVRFEGPGALVVDDHTRVHFSRAVIATGTSPHVPEPFQAAGDRVVTTDTLFDWPELPDSVAIMGPGVIGLELGQALARLDVRVRMFGRSGGLGGLKDEAIRDRAEALFASQFYLDTRAEIHAVSQDDNEVAVTFVERSTGETLTERFDYLLAATGRRPNLQGLDLDRLGIETDEHGVPRHDRYTMQCHSTTQAPSPIFIAGDVDRADPLLHEATDEGRIAGDNAGRFPNLRTGHRRVPFTVVFSEPQIAQVGMSLSEVEANPQGYAIGTLDFASQGRARVMNVHEGAMNLYGEYGTGRFLGAELVAPEAEHLGHLLAWACQQRLTVQEMLNMPFYHPTLEEGLRTALRDLGAKLLLEEAPVDQCTECGPGT
ncbi:dihydrolipoyl dehydrogenase [Litchfieldella xinjiangensis]|uniref:dihydrolipoyl dehydrogenase n=1 Tax=Litchfieldella xinjiangensis TaxID=1166948 RepID=UPI0005B9BACE|nr:dihydrolipoyl dehydrogenase [Halomonas xinjiangensis]